MNEKRLYQILIKPYTTEKSYEAEDKYNQKVFKVAFDATKTEIKEAVAKLFNVIVKSVRTTTVQGKKKRFKQREGCRSTWKKAYISLEKGQYMNLTNYT